MQYVLLIHAREAAAADIPGARRLHAADCATTVRVRGDHVMVTDGPATDADEPLVAYALIEVAHLDDAIALARRLPAARAGAVEIRPVREAANAPDTQEDPACSTY